eukprot:TRINITY_DN7073_c0_g1_i4.p1 TRINITY_DN7073_c0_g1~~TRINITY_DN7073_c0_g1_i4.p1  ORF type:complete len:163 (+),score=20.54 TRINITY_DN7073_c0_g1_i4:1-489(+)
MTMMVIALLASVLVVASARAKSFCEQDSYGLIFEDDFEGTQLNTSKWVPTLGYNGGQGREAYLLAQNVYLQEGSLVLRSMANHYGFNFTSGAVTTAGKFAFRHGRVCFNAILPGNPNVSQGIWPAHWMMPEDASCWPDHGEVHCMQACIHVLEGSRPYPSAK